MKLEPQARWSQPSIVEAEASFRVVEPSLPPPSSIQTCRKGPSPSCARLLLVDDEPLILRTLVRMLKVQRPNLEVVAAPNALIALEKLNAERFDVMITDLQMPQMRGEELVERALSIDPQLTCIVHSNQVLCMPAELRSKLWATLTKPTPMAEICSKLDDALVRSQHLLRNLRWL